jgi:hypothetical protein
MSTRLYDYILLPQQLSILYEKYSVFTHEVVDSYVYVCDVYKDGITTKTEYICVKIKKLDEPAIHSTCIELHTFLEKCLLNKRNDSVSNNKKNN